MSKKTATSNAYLCLIINVCMAFGLVAGGTAQAQVIPPAPSVPATVSNREEQLEARLRKMEAMNQRLAEQLDAVAKQNLDLAKQNRGLAEQFKTVADQNKIISGKVEAFTKATPIAHGMGNGGPPIGRNADRPIESGSTAPSSTARPATPGSDNQPGDVRTDDQPPTPGADDRSPDSGDARSPDSGDARSPGRADDDQPADIRTDEPEPKPKEKPTISFFDEGFKWETKDDEFTLNFHNETQLDIRAYEQRASDPVNQTGFYIPRMRLYFNGRLTKPIEYTVALNKGLGDLDLLDAYLNFNYDKRVQFRIGRYRAPFTYDFYALSNQFLTTPERSIFALNYGYNRNVGIMGHGELFDDRVDYAVGAFNGPRNSYYDANSHKDLLAYVNYRPFEQAKRLPALKHLNVGGSVAYGIQDQAPLPVDFRTFTAASDSAGQLKAGPSFLQLNEGVTEKGPRELWELHLAYYYKGLSVIAAWDSGFNDYSNGTKPGLVHVPVSSYHVATGYFLTGEHVERRFFVEPLRPFDLRKGKRGTGAIELQARFDQFALGRQVFTGGLADPNQWTNQVYAIDAGLNWYLNKYVKIYFDWQHSVYGNPVSYRPGGLQKTSDLFWLRYQIYF